MPSTPPTPPPNDFARTARRISSWTTNGLFTALVVVAALGLGRETIVWWRHDAQPTSAPPLGLAWGAGFDDPAQPVELELGDTPYQLTRQSVFGDARAAADVLLDLARDSIGQAEALEAELGEGEGRFLERLADQPPAEESPAAHWRLHLRQEGIPLIVGTRRMPQGRAKKGPQASPAPWRVVLWGLALPAGENQWTAYQFRVSSRAASATGLVDVPLPPGSRRVLSIGSSRSERMVAFDSGTYDGPAACGDWKRFFAGWFARHDPSAAVEWRANGRGWQGRYRGRDGNVAVQLLPGNGPNTGLVLVTR